MLGKKSTSKRDLHSYPKRSLEEILFHDLDKTEDVSHHEFLDTYFPTFEALVSQIPILKTSLQGMRDDHITKVC